MRVAFDASTAAFRHKTGTGVYCQELIQAYQKRFQEDHVFHTYRLSRRLRGSEFLLPLAANATRDVLADPWTFFKGSRYEIFHGLNTRLPVLSGARRVATVHDLFSIYGEFSDARFREDQKRKLFQMIARAEHIIVPARFTKNQLIQNLNVPEKKISVVGEGVRAIYLRTFSQQESKKKVREHFGIENPFSLFVGTLEKRKNVVGIIRAFELYRQNSDQPLDLILVGHPGFKFDEISQAIEASPMKDSIKILGFVEEDLLADLYRACSALLYLSLEEGFGIPVIEAMACGAPVISSNTTSLPEVGGGFSWLVEPTNTEAAARCLRDVLSGSAQVRAKVQVGQIYARAMTWTRVAEETRAVYLKVLGRKGAP